MSATQQKSLPVDSPSLGDVYYLLFRHKGKIIFCTLLGVFASVAVFFLTPVVYPSEAKLLVRYVSDTTVLDPASNRERITAPGRGGENVINSEIEILTSRDLIEKVMDEMGIARFSFSSTNTLDRARIVENIVAALNVEVPKNSNIIRIVFDGPDPIVSRDFLKHLTEFYLQKHIEIHRSAGAYEFLSQQTDQLRARLSETEEELRKLKFTENIVSVEETKKNVAQRTEELIKGLGELEASLAAAKARNDVLRPLLLTENAGRTSWVTASSAPNLATQTLKARLSRLQQRETELLTAYTPDSIPLRSLRQQIRETQALIDADPPSVTTNTAVTPSLSPNTMPALIEAQADVAALQAKISIQTGLLSRAVTAAQKVNDVETRIVQLQRSKELQEDNYKYFCQSLEHARFDEALDSGKISNISIVQPATLPAEKMRPKLPRNMGLTLLLGIVFGLGLSLVQERVIDHSIRHPAELQAILQTPLLMSVPLLDRRHAALQSGQGRKSALLLNAHNGQDGTVSQEAQADMRDLYDALRDRLLTRLGQSVPDGKPYILGMTSCKQGAGVSTIAAGLALALARHGDHRILLIEANADSDVPALFGVNPGAGLVEMATDGDGNTAVAQHSLYLVPSGDPETRQAPTSRAHRYAALIQHAREGKASFVIVDMPPVTETSLTLRISRLLDGVVLVVAAEEVNRHVADHARELLLQSNAPLIGSILNKRRQYVPDWLYPTC